MNPFSRPELITSLAFFSALVAYRFTSVGILDPTNRPLVVRKFLPVFSVAIMIPPIVAIVAFLWGMFFTTFPMLFLWLGLTCFIAFPIFDNLVLRRIEGGGHFSCFVFALFGSLTLVWWVGSTYLAIRSADPQNMSPESRAEMRSRIMELARNQAEVASDEDLVELLAVWADGIKQLYESNDYYGCYLYFKGIAGDRKVGKPEVETRFVNSLQTLISNSRKFPRKSSYSRQQAKEVADTVWAKILTDESAESDLRTLQQPELASLDEQKRLCTLAFQFYTHVLTQLSQREIADIARLWMGGWGKERQ